MWCMRASCSELHASPKPTRCMMGMHQGWACTKEANTSAWPLPASRTLLATMAASATGSAAASAAAAAFPGFVVPVASSSSLGGSGCDATGVSAGSAQAIVHTFLMILRHSRTLMSVVLLQMRHPTRTSLSSSSSCACRRQAAPVARTGLPLHAGGHELHQRPRCLALQRRLPLLAHRAHQWLHPISQRRSRCMP